MTDEVANPVLEQLRLMRADMNLMRGDINRIDGKVDALATELAEVKHAVSGLAYFLAHTTSKVLDLEGRVGRLETRP